MNDPLLEQLLDRAGAKNIAVDLVLYVGWGLVVGTTMSAADFAGENAKRFSERGQGTLADVFEKDEDDRRCLVDGYLHLWNADAHIGAGRVLHRDSVRLRLADVIGWSVRS